MHHGAVPTPVEEAVAALAKAGEQQQEIDELIAKAQSGLDKLAEERANKGRGRPNSSHASRKASLEAKIVRLRRGQLPIHPVHRVVPSSADELRASAAQHPQHHVSSAFAPAGRAKEGAGGTNTFAPARFSSTTTIRHPPHCLHRHFRWRHRPPASPTISP